MDSVHSRTCWTWILYAARLAVHGFCTQQDLLYMDSMHIKTSCAWILYTQDLLHMDSICRKTCSAWILCTWNMCSTSINAHWINAINDDTNPLISLLHFEKGSKTKGGLDSNKAPDQKISCYCSFNCTVYIILYSIVQLINYDPLEGSYYRTSRMYKEMILISYC